tara:strand:- start:3701 stop:3898 length:198 start_codon:yes stop_codon:yes gene_type:complete
MADVRKAMTIGSNHVALEVENFDEVAELLNTFLYCELRIEFEKMALIDLSDQFIALQLGGPWHGH